MTKDEALKLALEALTNAYWPTESDLMPAHNIKECADAITAIKEALENDTSQERVDETSKNVHKPCGLECDCTDVCKQVDYKALWQQMCERCDELDKRLSQSEQAPMNYYRADAEGNLERTDIHSAQPEQEPVGWYDSISGGMDFTFYKPHRKPSSPSAEWIPVYSRPPQRKPLTDEEIIGWVESGEYNVITNDWASHINFARAIEAAHGIKGEA